MIHAVILPVILPAVTAGLMVLLLRQRRAAQRILSVLAVLAYALLALGLLYRATTLGPEPYFLGNWPAPFGIVLILDRLSALMLALTAAIALPVLVYAIATGWDRKGAHFHPLFQFQIMGVSGAFLTGDAFNLFVFFEVLLIASYGLMLHGGGRARAQAGFSYVAFNLIGSTLFLFGLATLYSVTGTLNMADLAVRLSDLPAGDAGLARAGIAMLFLVFAIKGALVPLHVWLPGTYASAPLMVTALFAIMTKVGAYAILRFGTLVVPPELGLTAGLWGSLLLPMALVTLAIGAFGTLGSRHLGRMAAFAGIASMGTTFLALAGFGPMHLSAGLYYMIHSTFAAAALFLVADLIARRRPHLDTGLATAPRKGDGVVAALFFVAALASAGLPPASGFLGKVFVMQAWAEAAPVIWTAILVSSFLMILGFARAGSTLFWRAHAGEVAPLPPLRDPVALAAVAALVAALLALTLAAGPVTAWTEATAAYLRDPAPLVAAHELYRER